MDYKIEIRNLNRGFNIVAEEMEFLSGDFKENVEEALGGLDVGMIWGEGIFRSAINKEPIGTVRFAVEHDEFFAEMFVDIIGKYTGGNSSEEVIITTRTELSNGGSYNNLHEVEDINTLGDLLREEIVKPTLLGLWDDRDNTTPIDKAIFENYKELGERFIEEVVDKTIGVSTALSDMFTRLNTNKKDKEKQLEKLRDDKTLIARATKRLAIYAMLNNNLLVEGVANFMTRNRYSLTSELESLEPISDFVYSKEPNEAVDIARLLEKLNSFVIDYTDYGLEEEWKEIAEAINNEIHHSSKSAEDKLIAADKLFSEERKVKFVDIER